MKKRLLPIALEIVGIMAIAVGIGMEIASGAEIWYAVITTGSCLVAAGGIIWGKFIKSQGG